MLFCNEECQILGLCDQIRKNSIQPKKYTSHHAMSHYKKHSRTKEFPWFSKFALHIFVVIKSHSFGNEGRNTFFKWIVSQQQDFEKLKKNICTTLLLVLLDLHNLCHGNHDH